MTASSAASKASSARRILQDSRDGKTRWIQLRIPVTEGPRYRVGEFALAGNTVVTSEALRPLFKVQKTSGRDTHVDVTLKVEEQNRNQITFGAGASQFEGFFGQVGFQTANFLGRGETLNVSLQSGSRTQNYQLAFTEPYLFDRPITGGVDVFKRDVRFVSQFTQKSTGGTLTAGFPVANFTRTFVTYGYERVKVSDVNELFFDPLVLARNPFLRDAYLMTIVGPVRLVLFYDAGQVPGKGQQFRPKDFRTSTGAEIRFFMPVLNVPFRLIFAANPQRAGVLDDTFRPAKAFTFRFAVGSTF